MTHYLNLLSYIELVGGICTPIIWLSIKICCRVVENFEKNYLKKWDFFIIDKMCISGYKSSSRAGLSLMFEEIF